MPELNPDSPTDAEIIAINALAYIAGEQDLLHRFLAVTGLQPADIHQMAGEPGFLAGVLDFLMDHESDLLAYASSINQSPKAFVAARDTLSLTGLAQT